MAIQFLNTGYFPDNAKLTFGDATTPDLEIYHDASHSRIDEVGTGGLIIRTGDFYLRNPSDADMIYAASGGAVKLYHNNVNRLETTSAGVGVIGTFYQSSGQKHQFDWAVSNDYYIEKSGTALTFNTGGTYTFNTGDATFTGDVIASGSDTATLSETGLALSRSNSYIQSTADNSTTLNIGQSSVRWGHVKVDSATFKVLNGGTERLGIDSSGNTTFAGNVTLGSSSKVSDEWMYIDSDANSSAGIQLLRGGASKWFIYNPGGGNNFKIYDNVGGGYMEMVPTGDTTFSADVTVTGDMEAAGVYVGSTNTSYDFYNNGTTYLNGAVTVDDTFTQTGAGSSSFSGNLETQGTLSVRDASTNHQVKIQATVGGTSRIMAHNTNIGTNHDLDIVSTQIDFLTGSISGSDNSRALFLDSSRNATFTGTITSGAIYAPIYYDSSNSGYYLDPAGPSNLNSATFAGTVNVDSDFKVRGSSGEDHFVIAPQAAGTGTYLISYNGAETGYEPLRIDAESYNFTNAGTSVISTSGLDTTFAGSLYIPRYIVHDDDTYLDFQPDRITVVAGAIEFIDCIESTQNVLTLGASSDMDVNMRGGDGYIFIQGSDGYIGINDITPSYPLDVNANTYITGTLETTGDLTVNTDKFKVNAVNGHVEILANSGGRYFSLDAPTLGAYMTFETGGTAYADIGSASGIVGSGTDTDTLMIKGRGGKELALGAGGAEAMRIDTSQNTTFAGNVGIGTAPTSRNLSVYRSTEGSIANLLHYEDASNFSGLYIDVSHDDNLVTLNASGSHGATWEFQNGNTTNLTMNSVLATFSGAVTVAGIISGVVADATDNTSAVNYQQLSNAVAGNLVYQGVWNALTNTPTLASGTGTPGYYYIVSVAGTTNLDGIADWEVGDWAIFSDLATDAWQKIDHTSVLTGDGTGGNLTAWAGAGTSNTLTDAPVTYSGNDVTFAGNVTVGSDLITPEYIYHTGNLTTFFGFPSDNTFKIKTNNADALTIDSSQDATFTGNILGSATDFKIGANTSDGSDNAQLKIMGGGDATDTRGASIHLAGNEHGNAGLLQIRAGDGATGGIRFYEGGSERMRITAGKVGIGTGTIDEKLQVEEGNIKIEGGQNSSTVGLIIAHGGQTGNTTNLVQNSSASRGHLYTTDRSLRIEAGSAGSTGTGETLDFWVNGSERMMIDTTGKVGINTTAPDAKLDVNGGIIAGGKTTYTISSASLTTTGTAVAGLSTGANGYSAGFVFTCFGGNGYQRIVYSCKNVSGTWDIDKDIDEGVNAFDVTYAADGSDNITFTFKSRSGTQSYSPKVTVEAIGSYIQTSYIN